MIPFHYPQVYFTTPQRFLPQPTPPIVESLHGWLFLRKK